MGCGSSSAKAASPTPQKPLQNQNGVLTTNHSDSQRKLKESKQTSHAKEDKYDNNSNEKPNIKPESNQDLVIPTVNQENEKNRLNSSKLNDIKGRNESLVPMTGVAFEVNLDENSKRKEIRRVPKLQKLENVTVLTAEMLAKKQAIAEENRQKEIQRKLAKTTRRKKKLLEARELDRAQEKFTELEEKMKVQKMKRAQIQAEIISKQRRRELRAQQVRARAEKIREGGDNVELDLDPDNTYNADEEDQSWDTDKTETNPSSISLPSSSITQIQEQDEPKAKEITDNTEQSVHDFFEE
ncbi:arginine and glutamate-rich protein 1-A-like [Actinia tenebrosa]|uniref:Arginine and glutamate-rich protein 1-A-like n=1 Tax=Actinia tenebrosa TaxID=6105 RepID=A0A6P8IL49_ACTTE|nr:arginine and glutamate-rich protein 1-A-like [Actinia tenebrosa]